MVKLLPPCSSTSLRSSPFFPFASGRKTCIHTASETASKWKLCSTAGTTAAASSAGFSAVASTVFATAGFAGSATGSGASSAAASAAGSGIASATGSGMGSGSGGCSVAISVGGGRASSAGGARSAGAESTAGSSIGGSAVAACSGCCTDIEGCSDISRSKILKAMNRTTKASAAIHAQRREGATGGSGKVSGRVRA